MRTLFIRCRTRRAAKKRAPWAAVIYKIVEGYMAFETRAEFNAWKGTYLP